MSLPIGPLPNLDSDAFVKLAFEVVIKVCQSNYGRGRYSQPIADLKSLLLAHEGAGGPDGPEEPLIFVPGGRIDAR